MGCTELSIIVPCLNESGNIAPLVDALKDTLFDINWEVVFVDDHSQDGTIKEIRSLSQIDPRVRGILRLQRKGLSSAVIEGVLSVSAPYIAVMDGDLQHDEACLKPMLALLQSGQADIVVASRYIKGGGTQGLSSPWRNFLSRAGIKLAIAFSKVPLTDPMSGFFMVRRDLFEKTAPFMSGKGFKILFDFILNAPISLRLIEVPMVFRKRLYGRSKLGFGVMFSFFVMVIKSFFKHKKNK